MIIHSLNFFVFTAAVLVFYYLLPRQKQNYLLLAASYIFYITISWHFALVLLIMTVCNYSLGKTIATYSQTKKWLTIGIGLNFLVLFIFKNANFFVPEIMFLLKKGGISTQTEGLKILLPIGLSFYVLQAVSYLVDVYNEQIPASKNPVDFALYISYFPKLTAGPIERARSFLPKLAQKRIVDNDVLARSFTLIVIGLVRKVVVADFLIAAIPSNVFEMPMHFSSFELTTWLMVYFFGIYNDFAGYTDIVRGVSGFFGIELSNNFAQPLFSRSFNELWNRWHITLSHWLRDYIYFPLSRFFVRRHPSRKNIANLILPPLITMLCSGLWHGTGWRFLIWGMLMGLILIFERIPTLWRPFMPSTRQTILRQCIGHLIFIFVALIALVPFIMDLTISLEYWKGIFTWSQFTTPNCRIFLLFLPALWIDLVQYKNRDELVFLKWPKVAKSFLLALSMLAILMFGITGVGEPFIYQGF